MNIFNQYIRGKRIEFTSSLLPDESKDTFDYVLEYLSIIIQRGLTTLLQFTKQNKGFQEFSDHLVQLIELERKFRVDSGFTSILTTGEENEPFSYRYSILKKYISNILYLVSLSGFSICDKIS